MRHVVTGKEPCGRCMIIAKDIINSKIAVDRSIRHTKMARRRFLEIPMNHTASVENGNEVAQE